MKKIINTLASHNLLVLACLMFFVFAMTTDAVGPIIQRIIQDYQLSLAQASAFHYTPMIAIALSGLFCGFLADKIGKQRSVIIGLTLCAISYALFMVSTSFEFFLVLLFASGIAIGIFKTAILALLSDITHSNAEHARMMNLIEGFFGLGAIFGPAIVVQLLSRDISWTYLYLIGAILCLALVAPAAMSKFPKRIQEVSHEPINLMRTFDIMRNPFAIGFSLAIVLYVATEVSIFVWLPTLLENYQGPLVSFVAYAVSIFFILRAAGRFIAVWALTKVSWSLVMLVCSAMIVVCFMASMYWGTSVAIYLLPFSGLFMSMIYPTLNSKGMSCFAKNQQGTIAGVILFFTAAAAALGPWSMGLISDLYGGDLRYGFYLASSFASGLFVLMLYNHIAQPAQMRLKTCEQS